VTVTAGVNSIWSLDPASFQGATIPWQESVVSRDASKLLSSSLQLRSRSRLRILLSYKRACCPYSGSWVSSVPGSVVLRVALSLNRWERFEYLHPAAGHCDLNLNPNATSIFIEWAPTQPNPSRKRGFHVPSLRLRLRLRLILLFNVVLFEP
jgi:hypothetical protein